jgi:hypothetical protein
MLALSTTAVLVAYILIPAAVFRVVFSWFVPLKKSPRTRAEEITFALLIAVLPFQLARALAFGHGLLAPFELDAAGLATWRVLAEAVLSDDLGVHTAAFWEALGRVAAHQRHFVAAFYVLVVVEAVLFGLVGRYHGTMVAALEPGAGRLAPLRRCARALLRFASARLLFPSISEWDAVFTPSLFVPRRQRATAHVDVLTTDDHLYRGQVADYFLDAQGKLSGLYLVGAQRFQREEFTAARKAPAPPRGTALASDDYWREIGGRQLFVDADKIGTINVRFVPDPQASITRGLHARGISVEVLGPSEAAPGAP